MVTRIELDYPMGQYLMAQIHIARCWGRGAARELEWFLATITGEAGAGAQPRNFSVEHVQLPERPYHLALAYVTVRLGVEKCSPLRLIGQSGSVHPKEAS